MLRNICVFIFLFSIITNSYTYLAPFVKKCKSNENVCLVSSNLQIALPYIAEGIQEIGIPISDPLILENISMNTDGSIFKFDLPSLKVQGGRKCKVADFEQNHQESTMKLTIDCPYIATGSYKFSGKYGIFSLEKEGDITMHTDSMKTTMDIKIEEIDNKGKKFWKLLSFEYITEPTESMHIEMEGLFHGDLNRARSFLSAVNNDYEETIQVGKPIGDAIVNNVFESLKKFFLTVPVEDFLQA